MVAKQTPKRPVKNQPAKKRRLPVLNRSRLIRTALVIVYTIVVAILVATIMFASGWRYTVTPKAPSVPTQAEPTTLAENTLQVHACSDSIASIGSYTYSTKYFFDLKQAGYQLADTLSQQASNGRDFTDADCTKYFAVRAAHPADHIILQLFTRDTSGNPLPYQYKDLKPDTCYYSDADSRTICPHMPEYGIFVKE